MVRWFVREDDDGGRQSVLSRQSVLKGLDLGRAAGLEIGPFNYPLVGKAEGDITYTDRVDTDHLRSTNPSVAPETIVHVDFIWRDEPLSTLVGGRKFDYVLASHVVEHIPDLIFFLEEIRSILKPGGVLRLIVPDRRYMYDYLRRETALSDIVESHVRKARVPSPAMVFDQYFFSVHVDHGKIWRGTQDPSKLERPHTPRNAIRTAQAVFESGAYHDVHCWVFTPKSFVDLFSAASELGLIRYRCELMVETQFDQLDFVVGIAPSDDPAEISMSWNRAAELLVRC